MPPAPRQANRDAGPTRPPALVWHDARLGDPRALVVRELLLGPEREEDARFLVEERFAEVRLLVFGRARRIGAKVDLGGEERERGREVERGARAWAERWGSVGCG